MHACHGYNYLPVPMNGTGKKKEGRIKGGGGRSACTGGYKGVQAVQPELVSGGGYF